MTSSRNAHDKVLTTMSSRSSTSSAQIMSVRSVSPVPPELRTTGAAQVQRHGRNRRGAAPPTVRRASPTCDEVVIKEALLPCGA